MASLWYSHQRKYCDSSQRHWRFTVCTLLYFLLLIYCQQKKNDPSTDAGDSHDHVHASLQQSWAKRHSGITISRLVILSFLSAKWLINQVSGLLCCSVGVFFFASPLIKLKYVIETKNTSCLPFPIILASFFVTLQWWFYGNLISDSFIQVSCYLTMQINNFGISLSFLDPKFSRLHFICNPAQSVCYLPIKGWRQIQTYNIRSHFTLLKKQIC